MAHQPSVGTTLRQRTVRNVSCQAQLQEKRETVGVQTDIIFSVGIHEKEPIKSPPTHKPTPASKKHSPDLPTSSRDSVKRTLSPSTDQTPAKKLCLKPDPSPSLSDASSAINTLASPVCTSALPKCTSTPTTLGTSTPMPAVAGSTAATPEGSTSVVNVPMLILGATNPVTTSPLDKDAIVAAEPMVTETLPVKSAPVQGSLLDPVQTAHATSILEHVTVCSTMESTSMAQPQVSMVTTHPDDSKNQAIADEVPISTIPHSLNLTKVEVAGTECMIPTPSLSVGSIEVTTLCSSLMSPGSTSTHTFPPNTIPCEETPATPLPADIEASDLLDKITTELGVDSLDPGLLDMADLFSLLQPDPGLPDPGHLPQHVGDKMVCDSTSSAPAQSSLLLSPSLSSPIPNLPSSSEPPSDNSTCTILLNAGDSSSSTSILLPTLNDAPTPQLSYLADLPREFSDSDLLEDLPPELQETVHAILKSSSDNLQAWQ